MKLLFVLVMTCITLLSSTDIGVAATTEQAGKGVPVDISEIESFWGQVSSEYKGYLPESQLGSFSEYVTGAKQFSPVEWAKGLVRYTFSELLSNGKLLGMLILLTVFSIVLQTLQASFEQSTVSKVADAIVVMVLLLFAVSSFHTAAGYVTGAVGKMSDFMMAVIPILLAMTATSGGITSAAFFHPVLIFLINSTVMVIQAVVLPLLFFSTVLGIVSELTDQFKVSGLVKLLRTAGVWILGTMMTIFLAVLSIQGVTTAVTDGIGMRTAKFVSSNVPVVGRLFTDAADTVVNASVLLKNTIGLFGLAMLFMLILFPAIKIFMIAILYRLAAAVLQPIGGGPVIASLQLVGKNLLFMFAAYLMVGFMFFLAVAMVIMAGNITMMVR